jgi:penicillin-binding protein 1C
VTRRSRSAAASLALLIIAVPSVVLVVTTRAALEELPNALVFSATSGEGVAIAATESVGRGLRVLDRHGEPLNTVYTDGWNVHDRAALHDIPPFLRAAFVAAEDKRFFEHDGPDWSARFSAVWTNVKSGRAVRGASTISEQVVRMLHPRPRTVWSRWLEGWEARDLERRFTKNEILEFYLNQVPYASNRRGVQQAASYYFARSLTTLGRKEMLALAVLVRAPTRFDLKRGADASAGAIERLAAALVERGELSATERAAMLAEPLALDEPHLAVAAPHFVQHARAEWLATAAATGGRTSLTTTLDSRLQATVQSMLDERMKRLAGQRVAHGAVLVVDHMTSEVLAWVVAGGGGEAGPTSFIDAVTTPRQPGSALKPFVYALALDNGWTAAQVIDDAPLSESTPGGLHSYQNYSRRFYGPVALRDALGNSLNIPAIKTLQFVGVEPYLRTLASLGFEQLTSHPDFYGDGIALGSGAVTLLELVQAYSALANGGVYRTATTRFDDADVREPSRVYSAEAASLVANILSDANARALEFGRDSVLAFPVQTAVKTGTSSDFRDAWAVGFNYRYTVGAWMGNLDQAPTDGVTGTTGPALLLRSVFAELTRDERTEPLYLSPALLRAEVCVPMPLREAAEECMPRTELFLPGTEPTATATATAAAAGSDAGRDADGRAMPGAIAEPIRLRRPTPGLQLAYDPRLPADAQAFDFEIAGVDAADRVVWTVDGLEHERFGPKYRFRVTRGEHSVSALVLRGGVHIARLSDTAFSVK